jgi:methylphosphotriester-DNA--protein-cysteine methyltransferase
MNGPEHYQEAERCLERAARADDRSRPEDASYWQREAQVHATLALAAATAWQDKGWVDVFYVGEESPR